MIAAGVKAMMTGPAIVPAMDTEMPSSLSPTTINYLRKLLGFSGLVVSDDLEARATLRTNFDARPPPQWQPSSPNRTRCCLPPTGRWTKPPWRY